MNKYKFIGSVILLMSIGFIFMNYGNINSHPTINRLIVEKFISVNNLGDMRDFKNYRFELYKPKLKGSFISKTGFFNPSNVEVSFVGDYSISDVNAIYTEEEGKFTPQKWIEHGGYAADVPEVPASLRHFYDPSRKKGDRYLSDQINSKVMRFAESLLSKPKTNGVDWALGTGGNYGVLEHIYTWEHGKQYMKGALEQSSLEKRNNYMAKAWRSLGETLHMIADNGCPPHVRNDGHPAIPIRLFSSFGNPDPYEEIMEVKDITKFDGGSIPFDLRDNFRAAKTTREIAHNLAVFTNENFFTNETISGTDWRGNKVVPITNPGYIHKSPKIALNNYDDKYYTRKIGKAEVMLCTDKWFFGEYNIPSNIPHIDEVCVESQAKVLIPTIKEAGVNVMKLFIPKLKLIITEIDEDGNISGKVSHEKDKEYTKEIRYNGLVKILNSNRNVLAKMNASGGQFSGQINVDEHINAVAEIEFGGIVVSSKQFQLKAKKEKKDIPLIDVVNIEIWFEAEIEDIDDEESDVVNKTQYIGMQTIFKPMKIQNNKIVAKNAETHEDYGNIQRSLQLEFNDNNKYSSLHGFSFKRTMEGGADGEESMISAVGSNIPFKVESGRNNFLLFSYKGDISKYLSQIDFSATGKNSDDSQWSRRLLNYTSPGEIKLNIRFVDTNVNWEDL